jgi:hypothetical protein
MYISRIGDKVLKQSTEIQGAVATHMTFDKKTLFLYSFYLVLASITWYVFVNVLYTLSTAILWKYSRSYLLSVALLAFVLLLAGMLLVFTCWGILSKKKYVKTTGLLSCLILIGYPVMILVQGTYVPYAYHYMILMIAPVVILFLLSIFLWRRKK